MKTVDVHALVEEIAQTVVFADIKQPETLAELPEKLAAVADGLQELAGGKVAKALHIAADMVRKVVAGEDTDPESLNLVVRTTSALQACFQDDCDFEAAGFPPEMCGDQEESASGEAESGAADAASDLEINLALVDESIVSEFLLRQSEVIDDIEKPIMDLENEGSESSLEEVMRFFHTLKGESGLLGLGTLADLCHATEDMMQSDKPAQCVDRLLSITDWIRAAFKFLSKQGPAPAPVQTMYDRLKESPSAEDSSGDVEAADQATSADAEPEAVAEAADEPSVEIPDYELDDYTNKNLLEGDVDLTQDFLEESIEHLDASEVHLLTLESSPKEDEALNAVFRGFHTIKGLAGFIELYHIQEMAHKAENLLDMVRKNEIQLDGPNMDIVFESVDMMKRLVEGIKDALESDGFLENEDGLPNLMGRLIHITDGPQAVAEGTVSEAAPEPVAFEDIEVPPDEDATSEPEQAQEPAAPTVDEIVEQVGKSGFIPLTAIKKPSPNKETPVSEAAAEPAAPEPPAAEAATSDGKTKKSGFIPLGAMKKPDAKAESVESKTPAAEAKPAEAEAEPVAAETKPAAAEDKPAAAEAKPAATKPAAAAKKPATAAKKPATAAAKPADTKSKPDGAAPPGKPAAAAKVKVKEAVRVDAERLDRMVDTIGELVIAETMVSGSPELSSNLSVKLAKDLDHLDKICRELQEIGMSLRMVPVRPVFQKMARLVRDLGKKSGRNLTFTMNGEETELDKNVVDKIGDPLVHMIRNAVDHGIEADMEERAANGKNDAGTVELRAFHKGGNICIEIEDDGRGLNRDAILTKATDRGLIKEGEKLSDREIFAMIFEPGFSTAKKVTDISGRGVGMDVVRRNIEELRGIVDISSTPGKGSVFSIKLPLTLAIIEGMVVTVGCENYIIPTLSVVRLIRPNREDISHVFDRGEMLSFEGEYLPLFRLSGLFEIEDARQDPCEAIVIIVEDEGEKIGLVADTLLGQQSIVIKSLGDGVEATDGVAGGAILSSGNVALILDIGGLVRISNKVNCVENTEISTEASEKSPEPAGLKTASLDADILGAKPVESADADSQEDSASAILDNESVRQENLIETDNGEEVSDISTGG